MKKILLVVILFLAIFNYGYSYEEKEFCNFFDDVFNKLNYARELCIMYHNGSFKNEELKIIEDDMKNQLSEVLQNIKSNKMLFENNLFLTRILIIIDYEVNNIYNTKLVKNSNEIIDEIIRKIDMLTELIMLAHIINYYDTMIPDNYEP